MHTVQRYVTSIYFAPIGYRHSELGRIVLSTCIPMALFTLEFAMRTFPLTQQ